MILNNKKVAAVSVLAACVLAVTACGKKEVNVTKDSPFNDKASYAVGASVGTYLRKMEDTQKEFIDPFNNEIVLQGFKDALADKATLDNKEIEDVLRSVDQKMQESMAKKAKEEAEKNLAEGNKFLDENKKKEGVKVTESGLQYKVITEGKGDHPKKGDMISVTYKGTTIDDKVFDEQKEPVDFPLDNMIPGWVEGLQMMTPGAEYELVIPSNLAYGENGAGDVIKPNSVLKFDVKLHAINKPADKKQDKTEPAKAEPAKAEPAKAEPAKAE